MRPRVTSSTLSSCWRGSNLPPLRIAKQSRNRASPPRVRNVVSSTSVSSTYARDDSCAEVGRIEQWPPRSQSRMRPNVLPASSRGMQHQSMLAVLDTSATEWQSEMNA